LSKEGQTSRQGYGRHRGRWSFPGQTIRFFAHSSQCRWVHALERAVAIDARYDHHDLGFGHWTTTNIFSTRGRRSRQAQGKGKGQREGLQSIQGDHSILRMNAGMTREDLLGFFFNTSLCDVPSQRQGKGEEDQNRARKQAKRVYFLVLATGHFASDAPSECTIITIFHAHHLFWRFLCSGQIFLSLALSLLEAWRSVTGMEKKLRRGQGGWQWLAGDACEERTPVPFF